MRGRGVLVGLATIVALGGLAAGAGAQGTIDCDALPDSALREPAQHRESCPTPATPWVSPDAGRFPTDTGYAQDIGFISDNFVSFTLNDFPGQTVVGTSTNAYYGIDFDPTATTLYALNDDTGELGTIDLATGAFTAVVSAPAPGGGNWTGLTIAADGTFWTSTSTDLYTLDPATGVSTLVGPFGIASGIMIDIAVNAAGAMYGHDINTDSIYTIDTATGAATLVGATGLASNFAQGMDFDFSDGTLYVFTYQGGGANVFGTVDLATGAVTPLATDNPQGEFEGAIQVAAGENLFCNGPVVQFEDGIPMTWTNLDNGGPFAWVTTADASVTANETGGAGEAATADADAFGSSGVSYDAELWTNRFSLATASAATLNYRYRYNNLDSGDFFDIDISTDGGSTWTNLVNYTADNPGGTSGDAGVLDLSAYAGEADVWLRFRYSGDGWDWYAQVDELQLTCTLPAITLDMTVGTTSGVCGTDEEIVVAPGTTVTYCYTVTNTGNTPLDLHDLVDDQLGTLLTAFSNTLAPGASLPYTYDAVANATADHIATWTAYNAGPADVAVASDSARVAVSGPAPLVCNGATVGFDAGIPPDWTVANNVPGNPVEWTNIAGSGESGNYTNGTGDAATASSDLQGGGSGSYDTELWTPAFDTTGLNFVQLEYTANYQNFAGGDFLDVDVSVDGGTSWTNVLSWNEDHPDAGANGVVGDGEDVVIDISSVAGNQPSVIIRWRYYDPAGPSTSLDWYAQIDNAALTCAIPVELQSFSVE